MSMHPSLKSRKFKKHGKNTGGKSWRGGKCYRIGEGPKPKSGTTITTVNPLPDHKY